VSKEPFPLHIVVNYNSISKLKWGEFEVDYAKTQIDTYTKNKLKDIAKEIDNHKESIRLLLSTANTTIEKLENQKEALNDLIQKAAELQTKIEDQKKKLIALNDSAEKTKKDIVKLNHASEQIALILVRISYFTLETSGEFGTKRAKKAMQEVESDLRKLLPIIIPDEKERSAWVSKLSNTLPQ